MTQALCDNLKRAPNWRWLRVMEIDGGGFKATKALDGSDGFRWIRRALRFKRRFDAAGNQTPAIYAVVLADRPLFWAHSIWADEKSPVRWVIEARILAGESNDEIAEKLGTKADIIDVYANTFFDVRSKLQNMDYVLTVVLADAVTRGLQERHYDLLWKMLGYCGGAHVLDAAISRFTKMAKPDNPEQVSTFFQEFAVNTMKYKAALSAMTVQVNTHTQLPLIDSFVKYVEIERTTENAVKAQSSIVDNIGEMLKSLTFTVGTKLEANPIKVLPYDEQAAELRSDELLAAAVGGIVLNGDDIQKLNFPEKDNAGT